jgi:glycyl-tRNA synthetase beta chain
MIKPSAQPSRPQAGKSGKAELLLEIGVEELPYQFIDPALSALKDLAVSLFEEARLSSGSVRTFGTPRRLALVVEGLATHQAAVTKVTMGPPKSVAFDSAGQPTKAAVGFAAAQGVPVESLELRPTSKGEYVVAVKHDPGRPTRAVLLELLPGLVGKLSFPKAMKWNETGVRFARPVRWLIALFAGTVLPVEAAGVKAGNRTYGHRVIGGGKPVAVGDYQSYRRKLERHGVLVEPEKRRAVIQRQLERLCTKAGFHLNVDESLLQQAIFTTEWPYVVIGNFKPEYLTMPSEILMTSMKEHQGFFSVRDKRTGQLAPHFLAVVNNQPSDITMIRAGNERVLAARLADAKFFFDEDRKIRLEERVKKLGGVTFHQKLGTMAQKQDRVVKLARVIATQLGQPDDTVGAAERAAGLCKADLLTGIVREFPELQGIMGGEYAKYDGEPEAVVQAIREQYLPRALEGDLPQSVTGQVLAIADRLDSIAAFFHVGMIPTGSEDPFALRRHATAIVRIILEGNLRLNLAPCVDHAKNLVSEAGFKGLEDVAQEGHRRMMDFIFERVRHYGRVMHGLRDDVMEAVLQSGSASAGDLVDLFSRMKALQAVTVRPDFDSLIVGFKRASRIVGKERWDRKPVDVALFTDAAETGLHRQLGTRRNEFGQQMAKGRYSDAVDALVKLKPAIDAFFEAVMVNAEDSAVRANRLSLLKEVDELFLAFADFSRIVVQGT